jgi:lysyl-tRNA synthetase, class II
MEENKQVSITDQEQFRREKMQKLIDLGVDPFGSKFDRTHFADQIMQQYRGKTHDELEALKVEVIVAGRIMAIRDMGKVAFVKLQDVSGFIQAYIRKDSIGDLSWSIFQLADLGDFVGVKGELMLTKTGEITVKCLEYTHLSKALKPLPEKYHGLVDIEDRYRKRYLDLVMNEDAKRIALLRPKIIRSIQNYMDDKGFIEVDTPVLQPILGGAAARPFITHHNTLDRDFFLRIATEIPLKKLIVGGLEKVYEIGRLFRNEGMDTRHNPEFTTIEAYQAYADLSTMMELCENLIKSVTQKVLGTTTVVRDGVTIDFSKPFAKINMVDMVKTETGIDFRQVKTFDEAKKLAKEHHVEVAKHYNSIGHVINAFFEVFCEKKLVQPTFLTGHPIEITPLAKKDNEDPRFTQRFELFIMGSEYANAYTELNDPVDQKQRFESQLAERERGNEEANQMDFEFVEALEYGMPPTGGIGIGIDRLVMLLANVSSIREVLLFPHMKTK